MASTDIRIEEVSYSGGGVNMKGMIAWDASIEGPRPGILVVHEWWGHNDYPRRRATMLAELGYTAMALDMYGGGQTAANPDEAGELMNAVIEDMASGRARFEAAHDVLKQHPTVDASRTGAVGYCFGGGVVLHMARVGADLKAVASFHGALPLASVPGVDRMHTRVAVYHGGADVLIPAEAVEAFKEEMASAGADYELVNLPGAMHGFSNPMATVNGEKYGFPLKHSPLADEASWAHMQLVFSEAFAA